MTVLDFHTHIYTREIIDVFPDLTKTSSSFFHGLCSSEVQGPQFSVFRGVLSLPS